MTPDQLKAHPLLPACYRKYPHPDHKAMEWVVTTIEGISGQSWQDTSRRRESAREGYTAAFRAASGGLAHQVYNIKTNAANEWLRAHINQGAFNNAMRPPSAR